MYNIPLVLQFCGRVINRMVNHIPLILHTLIILNCVVIFISFVIHTYERIISCVVIRFPFVLHTLQGVIMCAAMHVVFRIAFV